MVSRSREGEEGPWPGVSEPELQISRAAQSARPGNQDPSVRGRDPDAPPGTPRKILQETCGANVSKQVYQQTGPITSA